MDVYDLFGTLTWILLAVFVILLPIYLRAEHRSGDAGGFRRAAVLKVCLSGLAAAVAVVSYNMSIASYAIRSDIYFVSLMLRVLGLFCCIPGDFFLQYIRRRSRLYMTGIVCFLAAQILLIASVTLMDLLTGWLLTLIVAASVLAAVAVTMKMQRWQLGPERAVLTIYTAALAVMTARSLVSLLSSPTGSSLLMFAGAALFCASDFVLGIWNYHDGGRRLRGAVHVLYFGAVMLIALSVSPMFDVPLAV